MAKKRTNGKGRRGYLGYKSYVFRTKDPVIDELRTIFQDSNTTYTHVHAKSGVSTTTMHNWFKGETRRPQNASIEAFGRALGVKRVWVKHK